MCSYRHGKMKLVKPVSLQTWTVWFSCTALTLGQAVCPEDAMQRLMACTTFLKIGSQLQENAFVERGETARAIKACRDKELEGALTCMETIVSSCQGKSDREHYIQTLINVKNFREFVDYFCSNLDEYERQAPCIAMNHQNLTTCVESGRKLMETKVQASNNMDYLLTSTCRYNSLAEFCSKKVLSLSCGPSAANIVSKVFWGFKPPICNSMNDLNDEELASGCHVTVKSSREIVIGTITFSWLCVVARNWLTLNSPALN